MFLTEQKRDAQETGPDPTSAPAASGKAPAYSRKHAPSAKERETQERRTWRARAQAYFAQVMNARWCSMLPCLTGIGARVRLLSDTVPCLARQWQLAFHCRAPVRLHQE